MAVDDALPGGEIGLEREDTLLVRAAEQNAVAQPMHARATSTSLIASRAAPRTRAIFRDVVWSPAPMAEYKVKGSHVVMANQWVDQRLGAGTFKSLVAPRGEPWTGLLLPVTWYEVDPLQQALNVVGQKLGRTLEDLTMEIAGENARKDLTTIYRIFMRIAAPQRVMSNTPKLWSTYVKFGEARAVVNEPGHYIGECEGIPRHYLEWTCGAWRGFVPTAIELAGGKDVQGRIINTAPSGGGDLNRLQLEVHYR